MTRKVAFLYSALVSCNLIQYGPDPPYWLYKTPLLEFSVISYVLDSGNVANAELANEGGLHLYLWIRNADISSRIARRCEINRVVYDSKFEFQIWHLPRHLSVPHRCRVIWIRPCGCWI